MAPFSKYYDTIDEIIEHIRLALIGPIEEKETMESDYPLSRYSLGILWGQSKTESGYANAVNETDDTGELFEDETQDNAWNVNQSQYQPSSLGISFSAFPGSTLEVSFSYGVYHHSINEVGTGEDAFQKHIYAREPKYFSSFVKIPDRVCSIQLPSHDQDKDLTVILYVRRRKNTDGSMISTISVINNHLSGNKKAENCSAALFQCRLSVKCENGFVPLYNQRTRRSSEEEMSEMLYDDIHNYSYGHGCSTVCVEKNGMVKEIKSDFLPVFRMKQLMPGTVNEPDCLKMSFWNNADRNTACHKLEGLIAQYRKWYEGLRENKHMLARYPASVQRTFDGIERCMERLANGVKTLRRNDQAWQSFLYMNEAMLLQRIKTKHCSADVVNWYPFQLAYILQIIPDMADGESSFRDDVDLLWFPTGGGKTEAYLGLSAFSIFYRRLSGVGSKIDGVSVIMRYTLRLLTIQQFQRATALICACEYMRKKYSIPGGEISIGLWIGSGMTPNHIEEAEEKLKKIRENSSLSSNEANPMQIKSCPWCGAEIGIGGYSIKNGVMNIACCHNAKCDFREHLPIYVVDDDIYRLAPTFVLSTVDKFARLTWEEQAGHLLGANGCKPPELIIQDELHLISGPLGSVTGLYEMAIDMICQKYGKAPKIIASTATVKNADKQIKILYDRHMIQFPPNGLSYRDSFFAVEADEQKRPARTYMGLCSIGLSTSEMLIKIFALLTYMKLLYLKRGLDTEVADQFYTYVGYFNSLKELGSNAIIVSERILSEVKYLISYKFKQEALSAGLTVEKIPVFMKNDELTSRNGAAEIKSVLERLSVRCTSEDCYDYIMASNMLSVGIDIDRLGVMCVYGQPKSNSEYIQATSRVGRTNPGLVMTLYNNMRSRDKSYFEQFCFYHQTFYKYVESTSVTSYSPRAIEKALHCAMMAVIRHTIKRYNPNSGAALFDRNDQDIQAVIHAILQRVEDIGPWQTDYAGQWLAYYLDCWEEMAESLPDKLVFADYHNEDAALFRSGENQSGSDIPAILNSVRNVEPSVDIYFVKR